MFAASPWECIQVAGWEAIRARKPLPLHKREFEFPAVWHPHCKLSKTSTSLAAARAALRLRRGAPLQAVLDRPGLCMAVP